MDPLFAFSASAGSRLPAWALGLSVATHAALLAGPAWQVPSVGDEPPPLVVSFQAPPAAPPLAASPPPVAETAPPPVAQRARSAPATRLAARAGTRQTVRSDPPAVQPAPPSVEAPPAPVAATPPARPPQAAVEAVAAPAASAEIVDPAALARYARQLSELLAGRQQYPRLAALRGWEGAVTLRLRLTRQGGVLGARLVRSSGFEVLDQHALQFVQDAVFPPLPADFPVAELSIDIPVVYSLKRS